MEAGLKRVFSDATIGKLLIQTDPNTGDPELHYCKLPKDVCDYNIILMDAMVGTGAAALMAIRVLLDHEVPEVNKCHSIFSFINMYPIIGSNHLCIFSCSTNRTDGD